MELVLSKREASHVLAALRNWQDESQRVDLADFFEAYFEQDEPLSHAEIDALCGRIGETAAATRE